MGPVWRSYHSYCTHIISLAPCTADAGSAVPQKHQHRGETQMKPEQEGRWRMEAKLFTFPLWAPGNRIGPGCWNSDFPRSETVWVPLQDNWFDTWLWLKYDLKWLWSLVWGCRLVMFNPKCYLDSKSTRNQSLLAITMVSVWLSCFLRGWDTRHLPCGWKAKGVGSSRAGDKNSLIEVPELVILGLGGWDMRSVLQGDHWGSIL